MTLLSTLTDCWLGLCRKTPALHTASAVLWGDPEEIRAIQPDAGGSPGRQGRIRIGIGRDADKDPADYVLEPFSEPELEALEPILLKACEFVDLYIRYDFNQVLNEYSKWKKSYSDSEKSGIISPKEESNDKGL